MAALILLIPGTYGVDSTWQYLNALGREWGNIQLATLDVDLVTKP